jgi:hypothetical protein
MTRALIIAFLMVFAVPGATPAAALSPDAVAVALAKRFDVKILRVTPIERDGKRRYAVVVMNPGGNFNDAFKVTMLVVDAETGDLVEQFQTESPGTDRPASANRERPADDGGAAIRQETFGGRR